MTPETSIDRRSLSHMAPEVKLVHMRLEIWGKWARDKVPGDWPERTILARLIEEGPGAGQTTARVVEIPESIAETDTAVAHLGVDERRVVKAYYTQWASPDVVARHLRLKPRQMKSILQRARWRLVGWFTKP